MTVDVARTVSLVLAMLLTTVILSITTTAVSRANEGVDATDVIDNMTGFRLFV